MAAKVNAETVEAKTIRKHYADLTKAIQDPLGLASELYSADVIARRILDSALESTNPKVEKAMHLLQAVSDQIAVNPKDFHCFLAVLKKDPSLQAIAELISSTYRHQNQGDFEQGKDEDITYPKHLKLSTEHEEQVSLKMKCHDIQLNWKQCSPLPITMAGGTAAVIGSRVYVHNNYSSQIFEYEILENIWTNEIKCPQSNFSLAGINELLTLVGGGSKCFKSTDILSLTDNHGIKQWCEHYKPMHNAREFPGIASNSKYFVVAGGDGNPLTVEVMEPSTQKWHSPIDLPNNDGLIHSATIIGDHLYLTYSQDTAKSCCPVVTCSLSKLVENCKSDMTQGIVRPLLWQKLPQGPPLYMPRTVQLCGNLVAIGGYMTVGYDYHKEKPVDICKGSAYVYDEEKSDWTFICRLPNKNGFPDHRFVIASLCNNKFIVLGGTRYSNDENESIPNTDIVHVGSLK